MYCHDRDLRHDDLRSVLGLHPDVRRVSICSQAELPTLFPQLEDWMRDFGYPRKDIFAVVLALTEVAANAIRHGNQNDPGKHAQITYVVTPTEVLLQVEDQGQGFDPNHVANPLTEEQIGRPTGRGLFLARAYSSWMSFNTRGNRVTVCRRRSAS
jgi:serine/threonine-protein kinase RsbW